MKAKKMFSAMMAGAMALSLVACGGSMLNEREMRYRQKCALDQEIPITNYGIAIAYMQGILKRCVEMFPDVRKELDV